MLRDRGARLLSSVVGVAALALVATACSDSEPTPEPSPTPAVTTPLPELPPGLLSTCTQVLNDRDHVVDLEAARASEDIYTAVFADEVPSAADLSRWRRTLEAGIAQTTAELELLRSASTDPAWASVLIPLEESLATQTARLDLTNASWPVGDDAALFGPLDLETDVDAALASLGMTGRDCESLAGDSGPVPAFKEFITSAAIVCSAVLDRRRDSAYATAQQSMLAVVDQVGREEPVEVTPALLDAMRALATEWSQTADDLTTIPGDVPDAEAWEETQQIVQERADLYAERVEALESGDAATIAEAFAPDPPESPETIGKPDYPWSRLELDRRDCRSLGT